MFKNIISPFQRILMRRRLCAGCTQPLEKARILGALSPTKDVYECRCKRRYILDRETNAFRRATFEEEALFLNSKKR